MAATRILRGDGYVTSTHVNQLDWSHEVFYFRLLLMADPKGLFHADPALLRSSLFPLRTEEVSLEQIDRMKAAAIAAGLIRQYTVAGKPYLYIERYGQRLRAKAKYPLPPWIDNKSPQPAASRRNLLHESESEFELEFELEAEAERIAPPHAARNATAPTAASASEQHAAVASTQSLASEDMALNPLECITQWLHQFAESVTGRAWSRPDRRIAARALKACNGAPLVEESSSVESVFGFLDRASRRKRPDMQSYGLVVRLLQDQFGGRNAS